MTTISLWQPHASLVSVGEKKFETRHWAPKQIWIGKRIAIHAAKRWTSAEKQLALKFRPWLKPHGLYPLDLPLGCIVCTCIIERWFRITPSNVPSEPERSFGNYEPDRFAWVLRDVIRLQKPLDWQGRQGPFDVPDQLIESAMLAGSGAR